MRRPIVVALAVLSVPVVLAAAGGWATITIHDLPEAAVTGEPMALEFSLRQHGAEPLGGMRPVITARNGRESVRVQARAGGREGSYAASLTVPSAGEWRVHVSAGFRDAEVTLLPITAHAPGARVAPQSLPVRGRHLFVAKGCMTCHQHAAIPGSGVIDIGPVLTARTYDAAWLKSYLEDPTIRPPASPIRRMPDLELKPAEVAALVAFINTEGARVARR